MFLHKTLLSNAAEFTLLRILPCGDLGSEVLGIQMSGKLSALFPHKNDLSISVMETCLLCWCLFMIFKDEDFHLHEENSMLGQLTRCSVV